MGTRAALVRRRMCAELTIISTRGSLPWQGRGPAPIPAPRECEALHCQFGPELRSGAMRP